MSKGFDDILKVKRESYKDGRGYFFESFNEKDFFSQTNLDIKFVQDNISVSNKFVIRGLHAQVGDFKQNKLVTVLCGEIFDVVVDLRKNSKNFGKYTYFKINEKCNFSLLVPPWYAHGFQAMTDKTIVHYKVDCHYKKSQELSISINDKDLNIRWPNLHKSIISEKDSQGITFKDFKKNITF